MTVRRPFALLLVLAGSTGLLAAILLASVLPRFLPSIVQHCLQLSDACLRSVLLACTASNPTALVLLLVLGTHVLRRSVRAAQQQRAATHEAIARLAPVGAVPPDPALATLCEELGLAGQVEVVNHPTPFAFCHGLTRPRIWLSTGLLALIGPPEIAAVLRHERAHLKGRHPLQLLISRALAHGFSFLPTLSELAAALPLAQELAADRMVMRECGPRDLGRALLALAAHARQCASPPGVAAMTTLLDARLDQLMGAPPPSPGISWGAAARTALTLLAGSLLVDEARGRGIGLLSWQCLGLACILAGLWYATTLQRGTTLCLRKAIAFRLGTRR